VPSRWQASKLQAQHMLNTAHFQHDSFLLNNHRSPQGSTRHTALMAAFEIATKADQAIILPPLLIASFLEQSGIIPPVHRHFVEGTTILAVCNILRVS